VIPRHSWYTLLVDCDFGRTVNLDNYDGFTVLRHTYTPAGPIDIPCPPFKEVGRDSSK